MTIYALICKITLTVYNKEGSMTKDELLVELENIFDTDEGTLRPEDRLVDVEGWDSMSALSLIALFDSKLSKSIGATELSGFITVADILALAGL